MSVNRALVDECLAALVEHKRVLDNYKENFRGHVEVILAKLDDDGLLYVESEDE